MGQGQIGLHPIDINHLPKGSYFVKITDRNGSEVVGTLVKKQLKTVEN
ncbi:MAG TPA: T9SS type A sorting domain-containing protein [Phaeodactylibacter sp.]|nr:T9SS type A sorting domain-containing protein [Phaeodactylibacter sp.]